MKTLSRALSLIISFQLMVGCNQVTTSSGTIKTKVPGSTDTMSISGSIASTIQNLSNLIIPSAIAGGILSVWDKSNINAPVFIEKWEISGDTYSIKLKKSLAKGKILKLSFESSDDVGNNREILIDATGDVNSIEAPINQEEYFKSIIFEAQLQSEFDSGSITDVKGFKARFSAMKGESFDSELALLGENGEMLEMIKKGRSEDILEMAKLVREHRRAKESGDSDALIKVKSVLFERGQAHGVIKDNQSLLSCSANQGSFFFKDRRFDVFALSEDSDFIQKFGGVVPLGPIENSDQSREVFSKLGSILTDMSKNFGRNISVRINFLSFDGEKGEMILKSCRLFGLSMTGEELAEIKDSSSGALFDESILNSAPIEKFSSIPEGEKYLSALLRKTLESFGYLMEVNGVDEKLRNVLMENQIPLIKALYESLLKKLNESFVSPKVSTLEMEKLDEVVSFDEAHERLWEMYNRALYDLTMKMVDSGIDAEQGRKILDEQTRVANAVFEKRINEFFEKFNAFKFPEYRLDLSPLSALSFEGVDDPYGLFKDTLEKSLDRHSYELMNQKLEQEIVNTVIQENRNYGWLFFKIRMNENDCHKKMLEILGSSRAKPTMAGVEEADEAPAMWAPFTDASAMEATLGLRERTRKIAF